MASYDYRCSDCSNVITVVRSISEKDPGYVCENCNIKLSRIYSGSNLGITFNGSGFYSKDK